MAPRIPIKPAKNRGRNPHQDAGVRDQIADNSTFTQSNPGGHLSEPIHSDSGNNIETVSPPSQGKRGGMIGEG